MTTIFSLLGHRNTVTYYRQLLPFKFLRTPLHQEGIYFLASDRWNPDRQFDVYIFPRVVSADFFLTIRDLKLKNKTIVIDLDDDYWNLPEWNPASKGIGPEDIARLDQCLDLADYIMTSTPHLSMVIDRPGKTMILPNLIDLEEWDNLPRPRYEATRVINASSIHHDSDLAELAPAVQRLAPIHRNAVEWRFFAYLPTLLATFYRQPGEPYSARLQPQSPYVGINPGVDYEDYPMTLTALAPDIGLAPLVDINFNQSKSNIKWLEYTMAGAATIASNLPPYQTIQHGLTGLLVTEDNPIRGIRADPLRWDQAITELIEDVPFRKQLVSNAQAEVRDRWTWQSKTAIHWLEAFKRIATR